MPIASIIITTHERPRLLARAIESAQAAGRDIEVIVVDDASTDETASVCKTFSRIKYVRVDRNQGVAGARNVGIVASSGKYLSFLDDDDARLPDTLNEQVEALEKTPDAGLIYSQAIVEQPGGQARSVYPRELPQGALFFKLIGRNFIPSGAAVFRRNCLFRVGMLDESIPGLDDWDLWVRIAEIYPIMASELPVTTWQRSTPASRQGTSRADRLVSLAIRQFHRRWMKLPQAMNASKATRQAAWREFSENMGEHLLWESARAVRYGRLGQAIINLSNIPRLGPLAVPNIMKKRLSGSQKTKLRDSLSTSSPAKTAPNQANGEL